MAGSSDIYRSRRTQYARCRWWSRDEAERIPLSDLIHDNGYKGIFYAREENAETHSDDIVSDAFMMDSQEITISTNDDVSELYPHDYVEYDGRIWIAGSVQRSPVRKRSEFSSRREYKSVIPLRGIGEDTDDG